jgi:hypothetical protein
MGMQVLSATLDLPAGLPLAGFAGQREGQLGATPLEVHAWRFRVAASDRLVELYSLDALYAGDLANLPLPDSRERILAASHTHYAPMLDSTKPALGKMSAEALRCYASALAGAAQDIESPTVCRIYRAEVQIPVYRRFDVPDSALNRLLTARAGMYPNCAQPIDRGLYLFEFASGGRAQVVIAYHACHPVSRARAELLSPDYVGSLRAAVRARFDVRTCLFLLGCAGDIRPNFACKRVSWLPRSRLNWRFEYPPTTASEAAADRAYDDAVRTAEPIEAFDVCRAPALVRRTLNLRSRRVEVPSLVFADRLRFDFLPFEVSHLYHLAARERDPRHFIVSCAGHTRGYLPHPSQLFAGGYEVDGSRTCMGMAERAEFEPGATPW